MASLYTVSVLMKGLKITKDWTTLDLKGNHSGHLIAIKDVGEPVSGKLNQKAVTKITLEFGYESGIEGEPIIVNTLELNFGDCTSTDKGINDRTAFKQIFGFPEKCYVRVKEICYIDETVNDYYTREKYVSVYNKDDLNKAVDIDINLAPLALA